MQSSRRVIACCAWMVGMAGMLLSGLYADAQTTSTPPSTNSTSTSTSTQGTRTPGTLRLHGLVEPVTSHPVSAPRLTGATGPGTGPGPLVVVALAKAGTLVQRGDLLVEFDRTTQLKAARDREAEHKDALTQIDRKRAEQAIAAADRRRDLALADNAVKRAELDVLGNALLSAIDAEKNVQKVEEARARLAALQKTAALQDRAAAADLRILEIQRDRAMSAWQHALRNAQRMRIDAPLDGLIVLKTLWKNGTMGEVQEGEEVRQGLTILEVVNPSAMRVRALVNQADVTSLAVGQTARITLDSQPDRHFAARLANVSPVAATSALSTRVRTFLASFVIDGRDDRLLPDLSAAIDVTIGETRTASAARQ